jgi:multiple sugar transport system permease protein
MVENPMTAPLISRLSHRIRSSSPAFDIIGTLLTLLYAVLIIVPVYYVFISSFKDNSTIFNHLLALPSKWDLSNFIRAQQTVDLFSAFRSSSWVAGLSELATLLLAYPVAYAIARIPTKLSGLTEAIFATGFLVPNFALLLPVFLLIVKMGLLHNPLALVLVYAAHVLPKSVILLASVLRVIPPELQESAEMDGANIFQQIWYIFLPLSVAGMVTVVILNFISFWGEYFFALILTNNMTRTLPIAISALHTGRFIDYGILSAGAVFSMIPVYIVFILFSERIMTGTLAGAVKE